MRHAYLIMAHNEFEVLRHLVLSLDDEQNDIFIHLDRKVDCLPEITTNRSNLSFIDERVDVRWGCLSQVQAEFALLKAAVKSGEYSHYCIISGAHLLLTNIKDVDRFIDSYPDASILKLWEEDQGNISFKFGKYHFFTKGCYSDKRIVAFVSNILWRLLLKLQALLGVHRNVEGLIKADQWCILSDEAVRSLLSDEKKIFKRYSHTFCPDEYVMATELCRRNLFIVDCANLLYTEFEGSRPRVFKMSELEILKGAGYFFARKFSADRPE